MYEYIKRGSRQKFRLHGNNQPKSSDRITLEKRTNFEGLAGLQIRVLVVLARIQMKLTTLRRNVEDTQVTQTNEKRNRN